MESDYISRLLDKANKFTKHGLKAFKMYEKILGTDCVVTTLVVKDRESDSYSKSMDRYDRLLKGAMNVDGNSSPQVVQKFKVKLIINKSQMGNIFTKMTEELAVTTTRSGFSIGDLIEFKYGTHTYKFKVTLVEGFGLDDDIVYKLNLAGFREYNG